MTLLEFFTGFITVFNNPVLEWFIGGFLAIVSGSIAYAIGGKLGYRGNWGRILWLITATAIYAAFAAIIHFIVWLISLPWWVWSIVGVIVLVIAITTIIVIWKNRLREKKEKQKNG